jgi:hypothetical protein
MIELWERWTWEVLWELEPIHSSKCSILRWECSETRILYISVFPDVRDASSIQPYIEEQHKDKIQ